MGGYFSGRRGGRDCTDDKLALDIRKLNRAGVLTPGHGFRWQWSRSGHAFATINGTSEGGHVSLDYKVREHDGEWVPMKYPVHLAWTACHYGGGRVWWLCPVIGCGRRVAVLYGGKVFACRRCHQLAYRSQREQPHERAGNRADRIRERLKWELGFLNGSGIKPKGMHWRTFERLQAAHDFHVNVSVSSFSAKLGLHRDLLES